MALNEEHPGSGPWRPDPRFDDPQTLSRVLTRRVLPLVSAPGRYLGIGSRGPAGAFDPAGANLLLTFPDAYEVGMSHQGLRILHSQLSRQPGSFCDLAFAPWPDMEQRMRAEGLPLYGLESRRPAGAFDVVGFSLGYELAYTNLLTMIDLSGSPLRAADRGEGDPVFLAGGSCTLNPTVLGEFLDVVLLGDGEEVILEVAREVRAWKAAGTPRSDLLARLRGLPGAWHPGVIAPVRVRTVADLNAFEPPEQLVPVIEPVHDRLSLEVMRGCVRGCRFCQAGMITRPVRERDPGSLVEAAVRGLAASGHSEVSLLSLSTSDYSGLGAAVSGIQDRLRGQRTNLVLPSLRVDSVDSDLYERISRERPASFTFAPEAGSQRLRDVINKQITDEDIVTTAGQALAAGVKSVKLYFMIGLPTETNEDLDDLVALVGRVVGLAPRGGSQLHVSISPFAPKAHTPFQWAGQIPRAEMARRNQYLDKRLQRLRVKVSLRDPEISLLEGVLGLGDAALGRVVARVWELGARFDGWSEHFDFARWEQAFADCGIDPVAYTAARDPDTPLAWDTVDVGTSKAFLQRDWRRAMQVRTLADCRLEGPCYKCEACGEELQHLFAAAPAESAAAHPAAAPAAPAVDPRNQDPEDPDRELRRWSVWRQQAAAKCWYRAEFAKTGDLIFLGHLDFQRQMQLALRRSGLPVAYSKGYHPHPLLKFGPPLPVGIVGLRECLDLAFEGQVPGWVAALNRELPAGLEFLRSVVIGGQAPRSIDQSVERLDYRVSIPGPDDGGPDPATVAAAVDAFLAAGHWPVLRRRPKGDIQIDARPLVPAGGIGLLPEATGDGCLLHCTLLRTDSGVTLPVHDFLAALLGETLPEPGHCAITRIGSYGRSSDGRWITPFEEVGEISRRFRFSSHLNG